MARNISDVIEQYLKEIIQSNSTGLIEIQRSEIAELFQCVPSQINYVISTRFSIEQGYIVESKRGGGGYIRIRQVQFPSKKKLLQTLQQFQGELSQREAEGMMDQLERESVITLREATMMRSMMRREVLLIELPYRDELRARLVSQMLQVILMMDSSS